MTYLQALIFGIVQGVTELFPISSLGHSVILPQLVGWNIDQSSPIFVTFLVATHAATALVLFLFFFKDWMRILRGIFGKGGFYGELGWLLIVGTVPAGIVGLLLQNPLQKLFATPDLVAVILMLNGLMLFGADMLRKNRHAVAPAAAEGGAASDERIARLSWWQGIKVGVLQVLALIPGFSRTGSTITGGLLVGLSYEDAARFSFLLSTPIIGAAALLKLPELFRVQSENMFVGQTLVGALAAAFFAYLSVRFLLNYFETKKLWPFGLYCVVIGAIASFIFLR